MTGQHIGVYLVLLQWIASISLSLEDMDGYGSYDAMNAHFVSVNA